MNLLADEDVDGPVVERLRQDGHAVLSVAEMEPGISDEAILRKANEQGSLLVTADKDFGEMVFQQNLLSTGGGVLIRLAGLSPEGKAEVVSREFRDRGTELPQAFSVSSPGRVRIRLKSRVAARRV
jgi:predicted nuclease of predicted toxin-antitoxin system